MLHYRPLLSPMRDCSARQAGTMPDSVELAKYRSILQHGTPETPVGEPVLGKMDQANPQARQLRNQQFEQLSGDDSGQLKWPAA